ncbi:hypothetical protein [Dactylosporangium sp. CA-233914]|uniref:hypothetical protein n=1 Tax=Dactylosporangium sp. CA-233914 TaxID=3239934 RepID=UPI003D935FAC
MRWRRPEPAAKSMVIYRGADGDPTVEAQLVGNGDLRLLSIRRSGVWVFSDVDTIGWWNWHTVSRADLSRLVGAGGDVLEAVRVAVAPGAEDETDDEQRVGGIFRRFEAWLIERGVRFTQDAYDEHEA